MISLCVCVRPQIRTSGPVPSPRAGHSSVMIGHAHVLIFGGRDARRTFNDVLELDLRTLTWKKLIGSGTCPCPRYEHTATSTKGPK